MGTAIKHPTPDRIKPLFVIFDIRTRSGLSVRMPGVDVKNSVHEARCFHDILMPKTVCSHTIHSVQKWKLTPLRNSHLDPALDPPVWIPSTSLPVPELSLAFLSIRRCITRCLFIAWMWDRYVVGSLESLGNWNRVSELKEKKSPAPGWGKKKEV